MKRNKLQEMGLDKEAIDSILQMNGDDINQAKADYADYDELKAENDSLKKQSEDDDKALKSLQSKVRDNDDLHQQVTDLRNSKKESENKFKEQINGMKLDHAVDAKLSEYKVRNNKTIKPLLDMDAVKLSDDGKLSGLDEQMETIRNDENNAFLFDMGTATDYKPKGGEGGGGSVEDQFREAMGTNK